MSQRTTSRVLLIDDDDELRSVLTRVLQKAGYEVAGAENGKVALSIFEGFAPDVVVTDLVMPEKEGIETIRQLRRDYPELPIVAISGGIGDSGDFLPIASQLGANATLSKPFPTSDLLDAIRRVSGEGPIPEDV